MSIFLKKSSIIFHSFSASGESLASTLGNCKEKTIIHEIQFQNPIEFFLYGISQFMGLYISFIRIVYRFVTRILCTIDMSKTTYQDEHTGEVRVQRVVCGLCVV